jgi:hypothetical protein
MLFGELRQPDHQQRCQPEGGAGRLGAVGQEREDRRLSSAVTGLIETVAPLRRQMLWVRAAVAVM